MILGAIGVPLSAIGAIVAITMMDVGPAWYPIALGYALPCAWLGGALHRAGPLTSART